MSNKTGGCGCGEINYTVSADVISVINCHCNMCRDHNGAAFTSYVIVPLGSFEVTNGYKYLSSYKKDNATKHFCKICGTPLFNEHDKYEQIRLIYLGSFEEEKELIPRVNVWCEDKLNWISDVNNLKSIEHGS